MRRWLIRVALLALVATALRGAEDGGMRASKPDVRKEITTVIDAQLAAFRAGDGRKAYGFASEQLRAQKPFRAFAETVQNYYPEIWASTRAEFGLVRDDGQQAALLVHVYSKTGDAAYDYTLVRERAGWRISSVVRHDPGKAEKL